MQLNNIKKQSLYNFQIKKLKKKRKAPYHMEDLSLFKDVKIIIF